jgi:hypothetical protein
MDFHPFAEQYPLLTNGEQGRLIESMKHGFDPRFPIVTYQGKILDGRNRWLAAIAAKVEPVFIEFTGDDEAAKQFVITANEERRHLSEKFLELKRRERIDRVAEARKAGESIRTIAEREKVSTTTVQRDLSQASTVTGVTVEPESGKSAGKDGKERPATRPSIFCSRCARVGPVKGCQACKDERAGARKGRDAGSHEPKAPKKTAGRIIFDQKAFDRSFGDVVRTLDRVEKGYGHKQTDEGEALRKLLNEFLTRFNTWRKGLAKK